MTDQYSKRYVSSAADGGRLMLVGVLVFDVLAVVVGRLCATDNTPLPLVL